MHLWQEAANSSTSGSELQYIFNEIIVKATFPIVVLDEKHEPLYWRNLGDIEETDTTAATKVKLRKVSAEMAHENGEFILNIDATHHNYLLYGDTEVIKQLKLMPFIQIGIVVAFMLVGLIVFQNTRRPAERHALWKGLAGRRDRAGLLEQPRQAHPERRLRHPAGR